MSENLFLYGGLRHVPLLEIILGRSAEAFSLIKAILPGHRACPHGPLATLDPQTGSETKGVRVTGLSPQEHARLGFYHGVFDQTLARGELADGTDAGMYVAAPGSDDTATDFNLARWEAEQADAACHAAREIMGYHGQKPIEWVKAMRPRIEARAASAVRAARSKHGRGTLMGDVEIFSRSTPYAKFFVLEDLTLSHQRFDGSMTGSIDRAAFRASDAAILLPYDPARDRVLLIEQLRIGPLARGDRAVWQLEPIAGIIDAGESPEEAATREALEEARLTLHAVEPVAEVYSSPGNSSEFYYIHVGLADLPDNITGTGGLESEHEDIRSHVMPFDDLMDMVTGMQAANAPLVLAALWLARHRERLRSAAGGDTP